MHHNKKGYLAITGFIFLVFVFVVLWLGGLGGLVNDIGDNIITTYQLTGLEAFFIGNFNIWIFCGLLMSILFWSMWSSG